MIAALVLAFIVVPIAELAVIVAVADQMGLVATLGLLLTVSVLGSWLAKRQGLEVYSRLRASLARGEMPSTEVIDGFLILLGAALLLTPGFLTDLLGLALLFPLTRSAVKASLRSAVGRYVTRGAWRTPRSARRIRVIKVRSRPADGENRRPPTSSDGS